MYNAVRFLRLQHFRFGLYRCLYINILNRFRTFLTKPQTNFEVQDSLLLYDEYNRIFNLHSILNFIKFSLYFKLYKQLIELNS